jgi:E3 ubiquitin-protein ligase TRIP12
MLQVRTRAMAKGKSSPPPELRAGATLTPLERCGGLAASLLAAHLSSASSLETEGLAALRRISSTLSSSAASTSAAAFQELVDLLVEGSRVSAFELHASAVVPSIIAYIAGTDLPDEAAVLDRLQGASQALLASRHGQDAVLLVARKLVSVLETMDDFQLHIKPPPLFVAASFHRGRTPNLAAMSPYQQGLYALSQPLKLMLKAAEGSQLTESVASTVLVEPLAKLSAVEEFLYNRWQSITRAAATRRGTESAAAADRGGLGRGKDKGNDQDDKDRKSSGGDSKEGKECSHRVTRSQARSLTEASASAPLPSASARPPIPTPTAALSARAAANAAMRGGAAAASARNERAKSADRMRAQVRLDAAYETAHMYGVGGGMDEDLPEYGGAARARAFRQLVEAAEDEQQYGIAEAEEEDDDEEDDDDDGGAAHDLQDNLPLVDDLHLDDPPPPRSGGSAAATTSPEAQDAPNAGAGAGDALGRDSLRLNQGSLAAANGAASERRVVLVVNGNVLPKNLNILQAVHRASSAGALDNSGTIMATQHTLEYAAASEVPEAMASPSHAADSLPPPPPPMCSREQHLLRVIAAAAAGGASEAVDASQGCLVLLRILETIAAERHQFAAARSSSLPLQVAAPLPPAANEAFFSTRTNARLLQQLADVVAVCGRSLPDWMLTLPSQFKGLLPFESRRRYCLCQLVVDNGSALHLAPFARQLRAVRAVPSVSLCICRLLLLTSFDMARTLNNMNVLMRDDSSGAADSSANGANTPEMRITRSPRQKVRVSRSRIRDSALKVFSMTASLKNILEFEFFNEAGTGLGPTLEFYTLLSTELQKKALGLWRDHMQPPSVSGKAAARTPRVSSASPSSSTPVTSAHTDTSDLVYTSTGLFPKPYPPGTCPKKVLALFEMMGKATAKCLQDIRLMDIDFAPAFLSAILRKPLDFAHLEALDPGLAAQLLRMKRAARAAKAGKRGGATAVLDGASIEDLCLDFTLPGYSSYELLPGGANHPVKAINCESYCDLVVAATLEHGVRAQIDAFVNAFDTIFDSRKLQCLYEVRCVHWLLPACFSTVDLILVYCLTSYWQSVGPGLLDHWFNCLMTIQFPPVPYCTQHELSRLLSHGGMCAE